MAGVFVTASALSLAAGCSAEKTVTKPGPAIIAYSDDWGHIFTIKPDGTGGRQIAGDTDDKVGQPDVAPDGRTVAYSRGHGIWIMNPDGSHTRMVSDSGYGPIFSPDGTKLAFADQGAVYVIDVDGKNRHLVYQPTEHIGQSMDPNSATPSAYTPDGKRLLVTESGFIVEMNADGTHRRVVLRDEFFNVSGSYSPDAEMIYFTSNRVGHGHSVAYSMKPDGSHIQQLALPANSAAFSPDGRHILYQFDDSSKQIWQIFIADADGTHSHPLTPDGAVAQGASWGGEG